MRKCAPLDVASLPVRVRMVPRPDTHALGDAIDVLRALGRRVAPKPKRQQPEEAIPCPS